MKVNYQLLDRYRRYRYFFHLTAFFICLVVITLSKLLIENEWGQSLIILNSIFIYMGILYFIEIKIGKRYDNLYYQNYIPKLIKNFNENVMYKKADNLSFQGNLLDIKIFDYDSQIKVNHVLHVKNEKFEYEIYDTEVYILSYRNRIVKKYKGLIILLPRVNKTYYKGQILHNKKPLLGYSELIRDLGFKNYHFYGDAHFPDNLFINLKALLLIYYHLNFDISINKDVMIFLDYPRKIFRKPVFKKINDKYSDGLVKDFSRLMEISNDFISCFLKD